MYLVIKHEKSEHLKHKVHELKELACDVLECLEEAYSEGRESESRERSRQEDKYEPRRRNYEYDDYEREYARGRGGRGRY